MPFVYIINYVGIFVWFAPPFRQYKSPFFYFFYILAISDPLALLVKYVLNGPTNMQWLITSCLLILSLVPFISNKRFFWISGFAICLLSTVFRFSFPDLQHFMVITLWTFILIVLLKYSLKSIADKRVYNIFHIIVLIYVLSNIVKIIVLATDLIHGVSFFFATIIFHVFIAAFFTFFREDSKAIQIPIKLAPEKS